MRELEWAAAIIVMAGLGWLMAHMLSVVVMAADSDPKAYKTGELPQDDQEMLEGGLRECFYEEAPER